MERKRRRREQRYEQQIAELRTEVKRVKTELQNNRRRLTDATKRLDAERERKLTLRREMETLEAQLKSERRRHQQELEQLEKKRKSDELRYVRFWTRRNLFQPLWETIFNICSIFLPPFFDAEAGVWVKQWSPSGFLTSSVHPFL